ncbi:hypothetical protein D9M71_72770 [compost metagenome]
MLPLTPPVSRPTSTLSGSPALVRLLRLRVTPSMASSTVLESLLTSRPSMLSSALLARLSIRGAFGSSGTGGSTTSGSLGAAPGVNARSSRLALPLPSSPLTLTAMSWPSPVLLLLNTNRAPWASVTMVALTPCSLPALLIASRRPARVLLLSSTSMAGSSVSPTLTVRLPLPKVAASLPLAGIAANATLLPWASCFTSTW